MSDKKEAETHCSNYNPVPSTVKKPYSVSFYTAKFFYDEFCQRTVWTDPFGPFLSSPDNHLTVRRGKTLGLAIV